MPQNEDQLIPSDTLIVLDILTGAWLGQWRSRSFKLRYFAPFYDGTHARMAILGHEGDCVSLFNPGEPDFDGAGYPIMMEVRASLRNDMRESRSRKGQVEFDTIGTRHRIYYEVDGVNEGRVVRTRTPDPARNRRLGAPPVDFENPNDELEDPYREDYSLEIPEAGTDMSAEGWDIGAQQRSHETVPLPKRGHAVTFSIASQRGRCAVRSLSTITQYAPHGRSSRI